MKVAFNVGPKTPIPVFEVKSQIFAFGDLYLSDIL